MYLTLKQGSILYTWQCLEEAKWFEQLCHSASEHVASSLSQLLHRLDSKVPFLLWSSGPHAPSVCYYFIIREARAITLSYQERSATSNQSVTQMSSANKPPHCIYRYWISYWSDASSSPHSTRLSALSLSIEWFCPLKRLGSAAVLWLCILFVRRWERVISHFCWSRALLENDT